MRLPMGLEALMRRLDGTVSSFNERAQQGFADQNIRSRAGWLANEKVPIDDRAAAVVDKVPAYIEAVGRGPDEQRKATRDAQMAGVRQSLAPEPGAEYPASPLEARRLAAQMNRGPLGGEMGLLEAGMAGLNNRYVRRGGIGVAGLGAVAGTGALLTEGAQQLMALTQFLQEGEDTRARAEQSPLT
jgi:hypothetical protein